MRKQQLRQILALAVMVCFAAGSGCMTQHDATASIRPAADCPNHFVAKQAATAAPSGVARSPMVDPRDGAEIVLVRSDRGWGDYAVPAGRYGVKPSELLRLDTATGRVIGIVQK